MSIVDLNRQSDLYFDQDGRVVFIPQGWCDDFVQQDDDDEGPFLPMLYGWIGGPDTGAWKSRENKEWFSYETQGWITVEELESLRKLNEADARELDPELFELLDAIDSGKAY